MENPRILLVEDESLVALDISKQLEDLGYRDIRTARSAEGALASAFRSPPDLALLDIKIDGPRDGIDLAIELREKWGTPVVFLTAFADAQTIERVKYTQPYGYLIKPIQRKELHSVVETALFKARAEKDKDRMAEEMLESERQSLQVKKMQAISLLTGGIAHELNNALMVVIGNINLAAADVSERSESHLRSALSGCTRAANLTKQLLGFSGQGFYRPTVGSVQEFTKSALDEFKQKENGDLRYIVEDVEQSLQVQVDPEQYGQCIHNILLNAKEAMSEQGTIRIRFDKSFVQSPEMHNQDARPGFYVSVAIEDEGSGIDDEHVSRIFEPFFSMPREKRNPGLGLAVVHGIMRRHGGWVTVVSKKGKGSTFMLFFPAETGKTDARDSSTRMQQVRAEPPVSTILIVDDEEMVINLVRDSLAEVGFNTKGFTSSKDAIEWYKENWKRTSLALIDMKMPEMNGDACFHRIREINPTAEVLFLSGYAEDRSVNELLKEGARGFLEKPVNLPDLLGRIRQVLATHN